VSGSALDTPMMRQFLAIKAGHPDAILLYRMGDFYEMFLGDAELAAPLLDITLTSRNKGKADAVPMCGIPVHAADGYVKRLAELGHRVAICEQVEDARAAGGKRLVRREVIEVVTPGLVGDPEGLDARREVAVAALLPGDAGEPAGLASLEASTGRFEATECTGEGVLAPALLEELERIGPREVLVPSGSEERLTPTLRARLGAVAITSVDPGSFEPAQALSRPDGFEALSRSPSQRAAAAVLAYLHAHQPFAVRQTARLRVYALSDTMVLDAATRAHLELFESAEDRSRRHTLIERIDRTCTAPGARLLKRWLAYPLLDPEAIGARQDAVGSLAARDRVRARLRVALAGVGDLERLLAKSARPAATPRDLAALGRAVAAVPAVGAALDEPDGELLAAAAPATPLLAAPVPVSAVAEVIAEALVDDPPAIPRGSRGAGETGYVRQGFRPELDALREATRKGREWIAGLEARERERLGIPSLKVRFHPVHGYAFDVTRPHLDRVPEDWERRQTLKSSERFTTAELREVEVGVVGAHERAAALEREIFEAVRQEVLGQAAALQAAAAATARLDALASLAEVARLDEWVRPVVDAGTRLEIRRGRHPVVEQVLRQQGADEFVPNDADLDPEATQILLLTGPNMSGKSTYLRQVALIALLAQIGSFVPAESARVSVVDRVFTRVGASDRLSRGESTFMVEMRETAQILGQASARSLVILDEIGRGTSTFDGLSIAWAVAEYLHDTPGLRARTLFATHYHELADLAGSRARVRNAHFEAREWGDDIVFLRRLVPGEASHSYGIQVARLAGLPEPVVRRAREILAALESGEAATVARVGGDAGPDAGSDQLGLFAGRPPPQPAASSHECEVLTALRETDFERTTPLDALLLLQQLRARLEAET
jgi:DNA mismatch repair protein MutS